MGVDLAVMSRDGVPESLGNQPIVLAVDDDVDSLVLIEYVLESIGCRVVSEVDSQRALKLVVEHQPQLILLDILLPGLNGVEFLYCLKHDPNTWHLPVIAVTALASKEEREALLQVGFVDYVSKPYLVEELEAMIRHYLALTE